ncbi:MAG: Uncharacterised protein [Bacteroidetes bacterium MED-G17]|nr:MAG: Uncharacterised protein [Bacteroidetes bacterium MED-G17]
MDIKKITKQFEEIHKKDKLRDWSSKGNFDFNFQFESNKKANCITTSNHTKNL